MPMVVVPCSALSSGTSAVHSAEWTTRSVSPAMTSYQYQPPSVNGLSGRANSKVAAERSPPSSVLRDSTRWERPLAIER